MIIDVIFAILMVLALVKGYRKGLIVAIFSLLAFIVGLAAAMKLSAVVAGYIGESVKIADKWLPVISFAVVFIIVVILVRLAATIVQRSAETVLLGWVNRICGIILYMVLYITVYSVILFYATQIKIVKPEVLSASVTWPFIQPWGPKAIDGFGVVIPVFSDMFTQLETFFGNISNEIR
jgi:membrane protein required for colicin V production